MTNIGLERKQMEDKAGFNRVAVVTLRLCETPGRVTTSCKPMIYMKLCEFTKAV